ncbi:MAG: Serine 3-dehydrogenase [Luteibacter sp.]|uniref:SDR family NAD(P)-dependent oxidoreductase n=1 Tax=Luteibacter sp. TaxID=1886636 RepID=UPI001384A0B9|nr:SDR family oxidoreductase [Luteibacter sp.]KAF1003601.1 MAG: Serine 3-dehydrogenase [Luteibacter sp.]
MSNQTQGTALITGASTGIGAIYADRLARRGYDLILVARSKDKLDALASRVAADTGRKVEVVVADLVQTDDLARVEQVIATTNDLAVLVNNAGVGAGRTFMEADLGDMTRMIALNVTAATRLAHKAAERMVPRGNGTVINIASIVAIAPELLNAVYGGSKAYMLTLSQAMHHELADKGIRVQAVLPGATATEFWPASGMAVEQLDASWVMSAADMVDASLAGLDAGELVTLPAVEDQGLVDALESARRALFGELSKSRPASRYHVA